MYVDECIKVGFCGWFTECRYAHTSQEGGSQVDCNVAVSNQKAADYLFGGGLSSHWDKRVYLTNVERISSYPAVDKQESINPAKGCSVEVMESLRVL